MSRAIAAVLGLLVLSMGGVWAFEAGLENAGREHSVTNESFTPNAGTVQMLDESNRNGAFYDENVTVYDENDTLVDPENNYTWFVGNGTIEPTVGGELDGDTSAKISYSFQQTTAEMRKFTALLGHIPQMIGLIFPFAVGILFLLFLSR